MKPSFGIVLPDDDPNRTGAIQLQEVCRVHISTELVRLDTLVDGIVDPTKIPRLLHFLSNDSRIKSAVESCVRIGSLVVNETFLLAGEDKMLVQSKLEKAQLPVPRRLNSFAVADRPLILKSCLHNVPTRIIPASGEMVINTAGSYLEQYIDADLKRKVYVIGDEIFSQSGTADLGPIREFAAGIRKALMLEVFSVDILRECDSGQWYIIDVNPASTYFYSSEARKQFTLFIQEKMS